MNLMLSIYTYYIGRNKENFSVFLKMFTAKFSGKYLKKMRCCDILNNWKILIFSIAVFLIFYGDMKRLNTLA